MKRKWTICTKCIIDMFPLSFRTETKTKDGKRKQSMHITEYLYCPKCKNIVKGEKNECKKPKSS